MSRKDRIMASRVAELEQLTGPPNSFRKEKLRRFVYRQYGKAPWSLTPVEADEVALFFQGQPKISSMILLWEHSNLGRSK